MVLNDKHLLLWTKLALFGWAVVITAVLLLLSLPILAGTCHDLVCILVPLSLDKKPKTIKLDDIPLDIKETIVGLALGDLYIRRRNLNTCLCFKQGIVNRDYIIHLYTIFQEYCKMSPRTYNATLKGKVHQSIVFDTLTYPAFNYFHELFYKDKIKIVPLNIQELLTPRGLAYWAMDDGGADRSGFIFYTNSFTLKEVTLLVNVLKNKFDLNCSIHTRNDKVNKPNMVYIKADSWDKFKAIIEPYVIPHFSYKLQLRGSHVIGSNDNER